MEPEDQIIDNFLAAVKQQKTSTSQNGKFDGFRLGLMTTCLDENDVNNFDWYCNKAMNYLVEHRAALAEIHIMDRVERRLSKILLYVLLYHYWCCETHKYHISVAENGLFSNYYIIT